MSAIDRKRGKSSEICFEFFAEISVIGGSSSHWYIQNKATHPDRKKCNPCKDFARPLFNAFLLPRLCIETSSWYDPHKNAFFPKTAIKNQSFEELIQQQSFHCSMFTVLTNEKNYAKN